MIGHFEEKNENKEVLDDADENKEVKKKIYEEVWQGVKKEIETINGGKKLNMGKIFKKFYNNDLPMNKFIKLHLSTIIIRCVFSEDGKFYPQLFLDDALYEL